MDDGLNIKPNQIIKISELNKKADEEPVKSDVVYEEKDIANAKDPLEFLGRSLLLDIKHEMPTHNTEEHPSYKRWVDFCKERAENSPEPDRYGGFNDKRDLRKIIGLFDKFPKLKENVPGYIELIKELENNPGHRTVEGSLNMIFLSLSIEPEQANDYAEVVKSLRRLYKSESEDYHVELWEVGTKFENMDPKKFVEQFNRLKPILDTLDLNFKTVSQMAKGKLSVSDEHIQKVASAISDIESSATPIKREIIEEMLKTESTEDDEKFEHLNKWLHFIDKNIKSPKLTLNNTYMVLDRIIFDKDGTGGWDPYLDEKCELYEKLLGNEEIMTLLKNKEICLTDNFVDKNESMKEEYSIKEEDIGDLDFVKMAQFLEQQKQILNNNLLNEIPTDMLIESLLYSHNRSSTRLSQLEFLANISKEELYQYFDKVDAIRNKMKQKPELYLNGDTSDEKVNNICIEHFIKAYGRELYSLFNIYDKEVIDTLMRKRLRDFCSYLDELNNLNQDNLLLLKNLVNSCNIDGKPFMPTQKIEFIDLIKAYKYNDIPMDQMQEMAKSGRVDLAKLQITLFEELMKNAGMTEEEISQIPKEKLIAWDKDYTHLLAKAIQENYYDTALSDILRAANLEPDFIKYIHNENNDYGVANTNTKKAFNEMNMNYDNWLKPNKENEIKFISKDKNTEQLKQIAYQITEDMNTLMQTPAKGFIRKQFPNCVKGDTFFIPNDYLTSKNRLTDFIKILTDTSENGQLAQVWKRAQGNISSTDSDRVSKAQNTLTVLNHLNQRMDDLSKVEDGIKLEQTLDLTIKMWDRNPQKDIFQGNYSTCCIGMGDINDYAMPHYILNTAYNMIELVDNNSGEIIGNALCYFVKDENGKPAFIIDNIEIRNSKKPSNEVGIELRTAMAEYASKIAKDVTGNNSTKIYMSGSYNDVEWEDLNSHKESVSFVGNVDTDKIYMDLYGGTTWKSDFTKDCKLYELK